MGAADPQGRLDIVAQDQIDALMALAARADDILALVDGGGGGGSVAWDDVTGKPFAKAAGPYSLVETIGPLVDVGGMHAIQQVTASDMAQYVAGTLFEMEDGDTVVVDIGGAQFVSTLSEMQWTTESTGQVKLVPGEDDAPHQYVLYGVDTGTGVATVAVSPYVADFTGESVMVLPAVDVIDRASLPLATSDEYGAVKVDGTTITVANGVLSAVDSGGK